MTLGTHERAERLARRIARVWSHAVGDAAEEAARNAVQPLVLGDDEIAFERCARAVIQHRVSIRRDGFADLDALRIELMIAQAVDLVRIASPITGAAHGGS